MRAGCRKLSAVPATSRTVTVGSLHAQRVSTFRLEVVAGLLDPSSTVLCKHLAGARRVLAVTDDGPGAERLARYLIAQRRRGMLHAYREVDAAKVTGPFALGAIERLTEEAVAAGLGRWDAFLSYCSPAAGDLTVATAALFRRHLRAIRMVADLPALLAMLSSGHRIRLPGDPLAVRVQQVTVLVDQDQMLASGPPSHPEIAVLRGLATLDEELAEELAAAVGSHTELTAEARELRRTALRAITRLTDVYPPGDPAWRLTGSKPGGPVRPQVRRRRGHDAMVWRTTTDLSYRVEAVRDVFGGGDVLAAWLPIGTRVLAVVDAFSPQVLDDVHRYVRTLRTRRTVADFTVLPVTSSPGVKVLRQVHAITLAAARMDLGDRDRILAVGGGTVLDMVGCAALLYQGGTPYLRVPTTLVGLIDAGIGLKVGVDAANRKNLLGGYHPPLVCLDDSTYLRTLPVEEIRCGLAEAIKIALVTDGRLFELIEDHHEDLLERRDTHAGWEILCRSVTAMLEELAINPFENEPRRLPDFGHELGHLLESASGYRLRHGEAVSVGMALSGHLAVQAGRLGAADYERMLRLLRHIGLPVYDRLCDPERLHHWVALDIAAQKGGAPHLVVPTGIGTGGFIDSADELDVDMLRRACAELARRRP